MKKTTQEESRLHNSRLILKTIYGHDAISRVDVSRLTGLTRTTVSDVVTRYIQDGLVSEIGVSPSRGGKPAILLSLVDDARQLIGIDLANSEFRGAVTNLRGKIVQRINLPVLEQDGEAALGLVYNLIEQLIDLAGQPILGIGIGAPGLMDSHKGVVLNAVNLDWHDLPLRDLLHRHFKLPIYLANDSQIAALAEYTFCQPMGEPNLLLISIGRGVGAGIVLGGRLFYGDNFGAGEIGHTRMVEGGERCRCGNTGCLETLVSSRAIVRQARAAALQDPHALLNQLASSPEQIDNDLVFQAFEAGDKTVQNIIDKAGYTLGEAASHLVGALNINQIVIGGSMARYGERLTQAMRRRIEWSVLPALAQETKVSISSLGKDIVILGAASLLLSHELGVV